jgi:hypothetical protein
MRARVGFTGSAWAPVASAYKCGIEPSCSLKAGKFLVQMTYHHLLKKYSDLVTFTGILGCVSI